MADLKIAKLFFLLGEWRGAGSGKFPTINSFDYTETLVFTHDGINDLIHYEQRTWLKSDDTPSHWESGFIVPINEEENIFEISNSQDSGRVEVLRGKLKIEEHAYLLHFRMKLLHNDPRVVNSERIFIIANNTLSYLMKMKTQNIPEHQQHLKAELHKIERY